MYNASITGEEVIAGLLAAFQSGEIEAVKRSECPVCADTGFRRVQQCSPFGKWYEGVEKVTGCCNYWMGRLANSAPGKKL